MEFNAKLHFKTSHKIKSILELEKEIALLRSSAPDCHDHKIVLTTGVFDLVHIGHIDYFEKAKSYGDILVVSVVDDKFVRKGPGRPIFSQYLRLNWLSALEIVDFVILNDDYGPWKVMKTIKPDIYVKGYNLTPGLMKDVATMKNLNGRVVLIPEVMHSTEIFSAISGFALSEEKIRKPHK